VVSSPCFAGGIVYVGSNDGKLYAFNATAVIEAHGPNLSNYSIFVVFGTVIVMCFAVGSFILRKHRIKQPHRNRA
jgi:outer membrane protein assembly factor BamB